MWDCPVCEQGHITALWVGVGLSLKKEASAIRPPGGWSVLEQEVRILETDLKWEGWKVLSSVNWGSAGPGLSAEMPGVFLVREGGDSSPVTVKQAERDIHSQASKKSWRRIWTSLVVCVCVCACVWVCVQSLSCAQLFVIPWTRPPGSSVHGMFQARMLQWVAISSSRGSSCPRGQNCISCISCIGR